MVAMAVYVKRGDLHGGKGHACRKACDARAGVRASIGAMKRL